MSQTNGWLDKALTVIRHEQEKVRRAETGDMDAMRHCVTAGFIIIGVLLLVVIVLVNR